MHEKILFAEFYLHMVTNKSDATMSLRKEILNGKLGEFDVANVFDILEGLFLFFFFYFHIVFRYYDISHIKYL